MSAIQRAYPHSEDVINKATFIICERNLMNLLAIH